MEHDRILTPNLWSNLRSLAEQNKGYLETRLSQTFDSTYHYRSVMDVPYGDS
jgi:hypothetical protein